MTRAAVLAWLVASLAHAAPVRVLLSIGNDEGAVEDESLEYAQSDARRVRDVFTEIGAVKAPDAHLLVGASASEVEARLGDLAHRVEQLVAERREVMLIVFVSAHASNGALHLGASRLPLSKLRETVALIPASLRVVVVDACSSGAIVRQKGGRRVPVEVRVEDQTTRGTVVISSSGPSEAAQEWESLASSLFTHHWVTGLRGRADRNADGRVTLNEAYVYARTQTVASAAQHPAYDLDVTGSDEVVLTEPRRASTALELAAPLDGRFVVLDRAARDLFLEFEKAAGASVRLALPPGEYSLRRAAESGQSVAEVSLPVGHSKLVSGADFSSEAAQLVAKKGRAQAPWSLAVEAAVVSGPSLAVRPQLGSGVWLRWQADALWLAVGALLGAGVTPGADETHFALQTGVGVAWWLGPVRWALGWVARPVARTTAPAVRLGLESGLSASLEVAVTGPVFVGLTAEGLVRLLPVDSALGPPLGGRVALTAGSRF